MTLDETSINQTVRITKVLNCPADTATTLQEIGLFCGAHMCKLHENRYRCGIFRICGCNRIMLDSESSRLIEVEDVNK